VLCKVNVLVGKWGFGSYLMGGVFQVRTISMGPSSGMTGRELNGFSHYMEKLKEWAGVLKL